jgi:elongation factor P
MYKVFGFWTSLFVWGRCLFFTHISHLNVKGVLHMILASQLTSGMTIMIGKDPYRVESVIKVSAQKANPFIKAKLRHLVSQKSIEKNFRPSQEIEEIVLAEHRLEYLYPDEQTHVFLDLGTLDVVKVDKSIISDKVSYLKEGIEVKGFCYGAAIFAVDLPQFLELMVSSIGTKSEGGRGGGGARVATLETGAKVEVPPFIDVGDVIKVDTRTEEYIQRV